MPEESTEESFEVFQVGRFLVDLQESRISRRPQYIL